MSARPRPPCSVLALLAGASVLAALSGCGAGGLLGGDEPATPPGGAGTVGLMSTGERAWALEALERVNGVRTANDLAPLAWDEAAARAAYEHSWDMDLRQYFDHVNPDGKDPGDRLTEAGVAWTLVGENIARGHPDPAAVVQGWLESPAHRANLLTPAYTRVGIGVHTGPAEGPWWTQDLFR